VEKEEEEVEEEKRASVIKQIFDQNKQVAI
jgi:hypothetical protein